METTSKNSEPNSTPNPASQSIELLNDKVRRLETELGVLKGNIQKRKRENTALKVLLYTGFSLLLIGFIYSNTTLQRVQLQSLEGNVKIYQNKIQQDLISLQESMLQQSRVIFHEEWTTKKAEELQFKTGIRASQQAMVHSVLEGINQAVSLIMESRPELQAQANDIRYQADQLLKILEEGKNSTPKSGSLVQNP